MRRERAATVRVMPHSFPNIGNAAEFVGQTPWSARDALRPPAESRPCTRRWPTRVSAADEGVRPTIYADVRLWENYVALGASACESACPTLRDGDRTSVTMLLLSPAESVALFLT